MTALIARNLLDRRKALAGWSLALGVAGAFYMLLWPSVDDTIGETVKAYPEALKQAFSFGALSSPEEFLTVEQLSLILPFALGVFAIRGIAAAINGAQERGYLDVLLSAPISRTQVVASAVAVIAIELAVILGATWALTLLGSAISGAGLDPGLAAAGLANVWPLALFAAGIAMLVTGLSPHAGAVTAVASGALIAMYLLDLIGRLAADVDWFRYFSVFHYYGTAGVDGIDVAASAGVTAAGAVLMALGAFLFERRDV